MTQGWVVVADGIDVLRSCCRLVVLVLLVATGCSSSPVPSNVAQGSASAQAEPSATTASARYCDALEAMFISQPEGSLAGDEFTDAMNSYADAVERVAALSDPDDALVMWELAAIARLVAIEVDGHVQAERLGAMALPVAAITLPAARRCGLN